MSQMKGFAKDGSVFLGALRWMFKKNVPMEAEIPSDNLRIEEYSATWRYVARWADEQIAALRERNDSPRLSEAQTTLIRGSLKMLKELKDLPRPKNRPGILNRHNDAGEDL